MDNISPDSLQNKPHYTYTLAYPESMGGAVFYIGKGVGKRIHEHEGEARRGVKSHKCNIIRKIWTNDEQVVKTKLAFFETHEEACLYEIALIFFFEGLVNLTYGGDGAPGVVPSEETLRKRSIALKGRAVSVEHRRRISESRKGKKGHPMSEETQRKIHESNIGRVFSEETRRKISEAHKGRTITAEHRQKLSEANKRRSPATSETRARMSASLKGRTLPAPSEEHRRKNSDAHKGKIHSEETRRKMSEANKGKHFSEEHRRKLSEKAKLREAQKQAMRHDLGNKSITGEPEPQSLVDSSSYPQESDGQ